MRPQLQPFRYFLMSVQGPNYFIAADRSKAIPIHGAHTLATVEVAFT